MSDRPSQTAGTEFPDSTESPNASKAFDRLAPFIQEFIWKHGWTEMRDIQVRATAAVLDTDRHLLLASGTASGKTEAAFLPVLTQVYEDPPSTVGALYIGPLKALINDQFLRLNDLCVEAGIPVTAWHGDIAASRKHGLLKKPTGVLQITPEALEGLLLNRSAHLMRLFGDLRWVVIDEIHAFMASDRGGQVLALLDRLSRFALDRTRLPRRIGLSATLGDYSEAAAWLDGGTKRGVKVITEGSSRRTVYLRVDHFLVRSQAERADDTATIVAGRDGPPARPGEVAPGDAAHADRLIARQSDLFSSAYEATQTHRSLIFANRRGDAEEIVVALRRLAERNHGPDIYHVHHGSIAAPLRESAEAAMRDGDGAACIAATVTLELGIDIGQLDRVLQLGPTFTVASFLQRLGRTGRRRDQRQEMFFLLRENEHDAEDSVLERIPWELVQTIALIQLYAEEKWIEPIERRQLPGSLLYHQTMSVAGGAGELTPAQLAERVLTLAPFAHVSQEDFRALLRHLLQIDHLERTEEGGLILGLAGEKVVRNFRFLATFQDTSEWAVKEGSRDVGTIASALPTGERFTLAGRTWEVVDVVAEQRTIVVKRARGTLKALFIGNHGGDVHDRVVDRMRRVLVEDGEYPYLSEHASTRLGEARRLVGATGMAEGPQVVSLGGDRVALVPWCGTRQLRTMLLYLRDRRVVRSVVARGFYLEITASHGSAALQADLSKMAREPWDGDAMVAKLDRALCERRKYDPFLPESLLKKSFVAEQLDVTGTTSRFIKMVR